MSRPGPAECLPCQIIGLIGEQGEQKVLVTDEGAGSRRSLTSRR